MCFGSEQESSKNTTTATKYTPNPAVADAATKNINFAQGVQEGGYTPYNGARVADFSDLQGKAFQTADSPDLQGWLQQYATAPAQNIGYTKISEMMPDYMNQYVDAALTPQLRLQQQQFDAQRKQNDAAATSSGAFGDQRAGIQAANTGEAQDAQRQGLIANAYNTAFNTAIGAGAQDVANKNQVGMANAGYNEQALSRALGGINTQEQLANFLQQIGAVQQQQEQAKLNVPYSDYLAAMQFPFLSSQLVNQAVGTGAQAMPASSTGNSQTTAYTPDNSGYQLLGTIAGAMLPEI